MPKNSRITNKNSRPKGRDNGSAASAPGTRRRREHHISVRADLRDKPDVRRIARAVIAMEMARAEAEAQAQRHGAHPDAPQESPDD